MKDFRKKKSEFENLANKTEFLIPEIHKTSPFNIKPVPKS